MYGGIHFSPGRPDPDNISRMDMNCMPMVHDMHGYGIRIDVPYLHGMSREINEREREIESEVGQLIGTYQYSHGKHGLVPFNIGSRDHLAQLFFEHLKVQGDVPVPMTPKATRFMASEEVLKPFAKNHPAVPLVLEWHTIDKIRSTYTDVLPTLVDSDSRLHTNFNMTVAATGRLSSSKPNCFDEETEVLTPSGWKRIKDLEKNKDKVAQWDNGKITFVLPTGYTSGHSANLVEIFNQHIDLATTSDHRCLLRHRKTGELKTFDAVKYPEDWEQLNAGSYAGGGCKLTKDEIRLMIAIQADGSWSQNKGALDFSFRKLRKLARFKELLKNLKLRHAHKISAKRERFYIPACQLTLKMETLLGLKKHFPWSVFLSMNGEELDFCKEELMFWDGCWTRRNHYASKVKHNTEVVATVFSLRGERARIRKYINKAGSISWQADVSKRDYSLTTNRTKRFSKRSGWVYCVSVPSSYLLVRRNHCIMVTGNCQNIPIRTKIGKRVRGAFIASPGKLLVSNDLAQIEMVWAAHRSQDPVMMDIFKRGQDLHTRTACGVYNLDYDYCMMLAKAAEDKTTTPAQAEEYAYFKQFQRLPCKTVGFGILYGQTPEGLSESLAGDGVFWSPDQCSAFIKDSFFGVYRLLEGMLNKDYAFVRRYAMICCDFGRPRLVPEAKSALKKLANEGTRKAGNHPEQASAQGTIKVGMAAVTPIYRKLNTQGINAWPLLQIHDQLIHEVDRDFAEEYGAMVGYEMETATPVSVPIRSSCDIAERWMDL